MINEISMVNEQDILNYWLELFPELKDENEFLNLIKKVNRVEIQSFMKEMLRDYNGQNICCRKTKEYKFDNKEILKYGKYIPFLNFFVPIISPNIICLKSRLSEFEIIEDKDIFMDTIVKYILDSLFELSYRVLILEVNVCRLEGKLKGETSQDRMKYFADVLLKDEMYITNSYVEYEPLITILDSFVENYSRFILEIIKNTEGNILNIKNEINNKKDLGKIVSIQTGLGDGHKGGKAVSIINFTNGLKLVYKPRSLDLDLKFNKLLAWIEEKDSKEILDFKKIRVYTSEDFGWMEFIENKQCENNDAIKRFYTRAGQYLCLLYVLNSVDFHFENLIAEGEYPMLIDMESIFHGKVKSVEKEANSGYVKAREDISSSVTSISLLPTVAGTNEMSFDLGGLSGNEEQVIPIKSSFIDNIEADNLKIVRKECVLKPKLNNPILNGEIVNSKKYVDELKVGFVNSYSLIVDNREEFKDIVQNLFEKSKSRLIIKATAFYGKILKIASHPDFMRNDYSRKLIFHRVGLNVNDSLSWTIESEYDDLMNNDIPYFTVDINDTKIINSRNEFKDNLLLESPMNTVISKINSLNDQDLEKQLDYIDMSYLNMRKMEGDFTNLNYTIKENKLTPNKWIKTAEEIGEYILEKSIDGINDNGNNDKFWVSTSLQGFEENIWKPDVLSFDLYNGNSGISLFLGYLGKILGRDDFKKASFQSMEMSKFIVRTLKDDLPYSVGAFSGLSGIFYTINKLNNILGKEEDSKFIKENVDNILKCIKLDTVNDVIGGGAGSLGVALSMCKSNNIDIKQSGEKLATESCNKLLKECKRDTNGGVYWEKENSMIYSGFSHGNAGIIAYLNRFLKSTNNRELMELTKGVLSYERSLYSHKDKNWYTTNKKIKISHGWCHGAPGVVLSKLMLKEDGYSDHLLEKEINDGLDSVMKFGLGNNPTYCHGDLGNLSIINYASKVLNKVELNNMSMNAYQELYENVLSKEWNRKKLKSSLSMSLMIGITGFGYSMLKNYAPDEVPEFLWLE
ncbi:type 2 lanthipeptide synthetase LanM family protein [Clostridium gasigenes]|uniref:type 2 lanthipeptide synthetase LanM family protein n=1 Tax=Clostridium gasigenes TaxID=94869 RepID=UPI001C0BFD2B|nr:type 2 lanthipeptide synthetase LanM family protein [Clostridium gasigenes]MBU3107033.1 type 2 lantipeptide synthetase LanM family protein [Clostridium gasigenes]